MQHGIMKLIIHGVKLMDAEHAVAAMPLPTWDLILGQDR